MPDHDDFDLIDDQAKQSKEKSRLLIGLMATLGLLLFGFAVGLAGYACLPPSQCRTDVYLRPTHSNTVGSRRRVGDANARLRH